MKYLPRFKHVKMVQGADGTKMPNTVMVRVDEIAVVYEYITPEGGLREGSCMVQMKSGSTLCLEGTLADWRSVLG